MLLNLAVLTLRQRFNDLPSGKQIVSLTNIPPPHHTSTPAEESLLSLMWEWKPTSVSSLSISPLKICVNFFSYPLYSVKNDLCGLFFFFWNSQRSFPLFLFPTKIKERIHEGNKGDDSSPSKTVVHHWDSRFGIQDCLGGSACWSLVSCFVK